MNLKKLGIVLGFIITGYLFSLHSQSVSETEVKNSKKVEFLNRNNIKAIPALRNFHESIGKKLSVLINGKPTESHFYDGVTIKRVEPTDSRLGADIIILDKSVDIGHINTIQRILSGYIQSSFQYKDEDAFFLARYVLYYNAINRGKMDYILTKYNEDIKNSTNNNDLGISKMYKDWAGHTQILVPLEGNILKKNNKDLTLNELNDRVNQIGEKKASQEDKKKISEMIIEKAKEEKKLIEQKKEEIVKEVAKLDKEKKEIEVKLKDLGTAENTKSESKKLEKNKEEIKEKIAALEDTKSKLENLENKLDGKEKKADAVVNNEPEKPADSTEKKAEAPKEPSPEVVKLEKELEKVKEELAAKIEEKSQKEFSANVVDGKIPIVKVFPDGICSNEIHLLDPNKDDFVFKGTYTQICGKNFKDFGTSLLVIGLKESKENIRLVLLDKNELKPARFSDTGIYTKSPLEVFDNQIYAIEMENTKYYLSRFDADLKRTTRSDMDILPESTITVFGKKIYVSARVEGGLVEIRVFNKDDLKFIKKTQT